MDLKQLMNPMLMTVAVAAVLAVAVFARLYTQRRRRAITVEPRRRVATEYEPAVGEHGSERRSEAKLSAREQRVEALTIRELDPAEREGFSGQWQQVQFRFVDDPTRAVTEADALVSTLLQARGYPLSDFNQRAADISFDYPGVVSSYRAAHEIAVRLENGDATAEDLRTAMIHDRSLFKELLASSAARNAATTGRTVGHDDEHLGVRR
jgi:hypothetical protein